MIKKYRHLIIKLGYNKFKRKISRKISEIEIIVDEIRNDVLKSYE